MTTPRNRALRFDAYLAHYDRVYAPINHALAVLDEVNAQRRRKELNRKK